MTPYKLTEKECTSLIDNCERQFRQEFPHLDAEQMRVNMGMIMTVLGITNAPINSRELVEALRYTANLLELVFATKETKQ